MTKRIDISVTAPEAFKAMLGLEAYLATVEIPKKWKELIKIRASQINHCAFCLDMHTKDAIQNGETAQRIFILSAWREATGFFTEEEQVVLEMTEEITLLHRHGLREELYQKAASLFTEKQIAEIIMVVVTINAWNRITVSTRREIAG